MKFLQPRYLLIALLASLPFERIPSVAAGGVTVRISMIIGLLLIARVAWQQWPWKSWRRAPWVYLLLYLLIGVLAALASLNPMHSLMVIGFDGFVFALAWAIAQTVKKADLKTIKRSVLIGACIVTVFAIYQFLGDLAGLPTWLTGLREAYTKNVFGFPRVQSTALEPLFFANYLLLPLALLAALGKSRWDWFWQTLFYMCVFLTVSRGGIAAALAISIIFMIIKLRQKMPRSAAKILAATTLGAVLAYAAVVWVVPGVTRLSAHWRTQTPAVTLSEEQKAAAAASTLQKHAVNYGEITSAGNERAVTRDLGYQIFKAHSLLGVGPGNFGYYAHLLHLDFGAGLTVNNLPLEILAETGWLGVLTLGVFVGSIMRSVYQTIRAKPSAEMIAWISGLSVFLVAVGIQYQSFSTLYIIHIWAGIGLLVGLVSINAAVKKA